MAHRFALLACALAACTTTVVQTPPPTPAPHHHDHEHDSRIEPPRPPPRPSANEQFAQFTDRFLADYLRFSPVDATEAGEHRYDDKWPDVSEAGDAQLHRFLDMTDQALKTRVPMAELGPQERIDAQILGDQLRSQRFSLDEQKPRVTDPVYYTDLIGEGLDPLVNRNFGTPESRLKALAGRLDGIPALVAAAKQRLAHPAKINTETAIQQNAGLVDLVDHELGTRFPSQPALAEAAKRASVALHDFEAFLKKDLLARSDGSFRLGRERFAKKLALVLEDDVDIDAIARDAHALLTETQVQMVETAKEIWLADHMGRLPPLRGPTDQKRFVKQVLDHVALDRSTNASILGDAKTWLAKATAFVREKDLVRVPDEPVTVVEMPEYRRGVAVAYCDSSGPLEQTPETFFAISPTPADWPKKRVESFYREYNQAMLADLSIHEAMPGHYLQLMHNNRFASKLRAVFGSGAFVEGWAVYSEWLMAEHGFGGPRVKLERQKMVLRLAANAILDHDIQAGELDEKGALALMTGEAFQEEGEAVGKWKRARLTSAQLTTYFYGFTELLKIRKAAEQKPGFSERAYHDKLLSYGSPAIRYVRELMR